MNLLFIHIASGNVTFDFRSIGDLGESTGLPTSTSHAIILDVL